MKTTTTELNEQTGRTISQAIVNAKKVYFGSVAKAVGTDILRKISSGLAAQRDQCFDAKGALTSQGAQRVVELAAAASKEVFRDYWFTEELAQEFYHRKPQ